MPWLDRLVAELLAPLAVWVFVSGLDDLFLDLSYIVLRTRDRLAFRRAPACAQVVAKESRIAILVPCWQEGEVIERMVEHNLAAIDYADYEIWLGVYPNDPKSIEKARRCEAEFGAVRSVVCEREGPTTKADCLNQILQGLFKRERETGRSYDIVVQHDAEDLIQQACMRLFRSRGQLVSRAYLFAAIRNLHIDHCRRRAAIVMEPLLSMEFADRQTPHTASVDSDLDMQYLLGRLRPEEREVLFLNCVEGFTAAEISQLTRQPRGTVLSLLARGKKKLRECPSRAEVEESCHD